MTRIRLLRGASLLRPLLALCGVAGLLGSAHAVPSPERAALEARVAKARADLAAREGAATPLELAANQWNNWPNWSNWAKWANG